MHQIKSNCDIEKFMIMIVSSHVDFKSRNEYGHVLIDSVEAWHPDLIRLSSYSC
jgi:hypothetical protein